jgi:hypothetical protein
MGLVVIREWELFIFVITELGNNKTIKAINVPILIKKVIINII